MVTQLDFVFRNIVHYSIVQVFKFNSVYSILQFNNFYYSMLYKVQNHTVYFVAVRHFLLCTKLVESQLYNGNQYV